VTRALKLTAAEVDEVWVRWRSGQAVKVLSRQMRVSPSTVRDLLHRTGGIRPAPKRRWELRLSLAEREEISRGLAAGLSLWMIAAGLGRAPSTVSREVLGNGGRLRYRAAVADRAAWSRAVRPKTTKLASRPALAELVATKLELDWSPQQIAGWLKLEFPDDGLMQVSHESIYRSLCRPEAACARSSLLICAPSGPLVVPPEHGNPTDAACAPTSSTSPSAQPRLSTGRCPGTGKVAWFSAAE